MALSNKKLMVLAETVEGDNKLATYNASIDLTNNKMTVSYNLNGNASNSTVITDQDAFDEYARSVWTKFATS